MTDQELTAYIAALVKERRWCVKEGAADRVAAISRELERVGYGVPKPASRRVIPRRPK